MTDMRHMDYLEDVTSEDVRELERKEQTYRGSWKRRGGVGAFMMMARKWDRLESILDGSYKYDVFEAITAQVQIEIGDGLVPGTDGTVLAEIRDLRRYLLLVEAEMIARNLFKIELKMTTAATASQLARAAMGDVFRVDGAIEPTVRVQDHVDVVVGETSSTPMPEKVLIIAEDREQPHPPASAAHGPSTGAGTSTRTINPHYEQVIADGRIHERGKPSRSAEGRGWDGVAIRVGDTCTWRSIDPRFVTCDTKLIDIRADGWPAIEYGDAPGGLIVKWSELRKQPVEMADERTVPRLREQGPFVDTPSCGDGIFESHQRQRTPPGFDIGNGHIKAGDFARYWLDGVAEICVKVLDVLQDGDATIDTCSGVKTVKWNRLLPIDTKNPAPRTDQQCTPEDGAQHASLAPWVVSPDFFSPSRVSVSHREVFWHKRAPGTYVLESYVDGSADLPRSLHGAYDLIDVGLGSKRAWILRMSRVPADVRDMFPRLRREGNAIEIDEMPAWQRAMYVWSEDMTKFVILQKYVAWTGEDA